MISKLGSLALNYAKQSQLNSPFKVFPLRPRSKQPILKGSFKSATTDAEQISAWWTEYPDANIAAHPDGYIVIDYDLHSDDANGLKSKTELEHQLDCALPLTVTAITPTGGRHEYYVCDDISLTAGSGIAPGIDYRASGGYIVLPGSIHPNGGVYRWETGLSPNDIEMAALPDAWRRFITGSQKKSKQKQRKGSSPGEMIADGTRNETLFHTARRLYQNGCSADEVKAAVSTMNRTRCRTPLPDDEIATICESASHYGANDPPEKVVAAELEDADAYRAMIAEDNAEALVQRVISAGAEPEKIRAYKLALIRTRAKAVDAYQMIDRLINTIDRERKQAVSQRRRDAAINADAIGLTFDANGRPLPTIENFSLIMSGDPFYSGVRFNLITNSAERDGHLWTDADDAASQQHIETTYGIFSREKHLAALRLLFKAREVNPLLDMVEGIEWDGIERCDHFLAEWAAVDDTPYTREVSRLIFAGGIHRLYLPGCKFDDVPVLIGKQGSGKSTLVRWLAINDDYYSEATTISGQRAIEQLAGAWIVEFAELSAIKSEKNAEAVKAYITRQRDRYRKPYDRNVSELPRRCTFIGTTNVSQFLTDQTGGRRFYPVTVNCNGYELHDHERECREYIVQCWGEAREKYLSGQMPACADRSLIAEYRAAQDQAQEDDWRVGKIAQYLNRMRIGDRVCVVMIYREALVPDPDRPQNPTARESREIGKIMQNFTDWERRGSRNFELYGSQKCWERMRGGEPPF